MGTPTRRLVDYYAFLGVAPTADDETILAAYRAKVRQADPETVQRADRALAVLTDPAQRVAYDRARGPAPSSAPGAGRAASPQRGTIAPRPARPAAGPGRGARGAGAARPPQPGVAPSGAAARWVLGGLAGMAVLLGLMIISLLMQSRPADAPAAAPSTDLRAQAVVAPIGGDGVQTVDLVVLGNTMSYRPQVIQLKQGVPARFNVSIEGADPG